MDFTYFRLTILIIFIFSSHIFTILSAQETQSLKKHASLFEEFTDAIDDAKFKFFHPGVDPAELEKHEFLAAHNKVRIHARQPLFIWDPTLTLYAKQYAEKRADDCELVHSNGEYGENIFWGSGNQWSPRDVVRLWVREHKYYDRATNTCRSREMCGHYTQIVWRDSIRLGCARIECKNGDIFAICSYDPPGNYIGENPFGDEI